MQASTVVRLDRSVRSFLPGVTDGDGKPIPIAIDLISGLTFKKVGNGMPWSHRRPHKPEEVKNNKALADAIAADVHQCHDEDEHFRGIWVLLQDEDEGPATAATAAA